MRGQHENLHINGWEPECICITWIRFANLAEGHHTVQATVATNMMVDYASESGMFKSDGALHVRWFFDLT